MIPAGKDWCKQFPTSVSLDDLISPFKENCKAFIAALEAAGAKVSIAATFRPPERAYLMHYCCMIAFSKMDPAAVPPMAGVDIQWDLGNAPDSIRAASDMAKGYDIAFPAALVSRHTQRRAIDMTVSFQGNATLELPHIEIRSTVPSTLWAAGATFKVIKLISDPPHWSDDGH